MNINTDTMTKVQDVNKRSRSPDLKYSDQTERWTMNESVQDALNLGDSRGLDMYIAEDVDSGEKIVLVEIVDSDDADFFTGSGNVFIARRLADAIDHHSFALTPVEHLDGEFYALNEWEGESDILENDLMISNDSEDEEMIDLSEEEEETDHDDFDYDADDFVSEENEEGTSLA